MPIAIDTKRRVEYVLRSERNLDAPTVFLLRPLTYRERCDLSDRVLVNNDGEQFVLSGTVQRKRLRFGLTGWRAFKLADGSDAPFGTDRDGIASDATLDYLDAATASELSEAIADLSTVTKSERD